MVLDIPSTSPLSGYLSPGDLIVSLDGKYIHNVREWMEATTLIDEQTLQNLNHSDHSRGSVVRSRKGYCITTSMMAESEKVLFVDNQYTCPNGLTEFVMINCFDSSELDNLRTEVNQPNRSRCRRCFNAGDVVKLNKCGDGWRTGIINGSRLLCSQVIVLKFSASDYP
uniref:Uncharacterized protein MANES_18G124500 n=1 Tax=Rhizophora mucronata TaxID=61149 RepID=A0A2P2JQX8_RHIMU